MLIVRYHCGGWSKGILILSYMVYLSPKHSWGYYLHLTTGIYLHIYKSQYIWRSPLAFLLPLLIPSCPLSLSPLLTWKPSLLWQDPSTLVSGYLQTDLPFLNPFPFPPHSKFPVPRLNMRLTTTTSRIRLLLSGTLIIVYMRMCELGTSGQAPKSGTAKPNSDRGKSVKESINSPL